MRSQSGDAGLGRVLDLPGRLAEVGAQTPLTPANEAVSGLLAAVRALDDPVPAEFTREFQPSTIYHPVPQEFLDTVISQSLKLPARVWRDYAEQAALSMDEDYVAELREIDTPTLMLWGAQDALFPHEEHERLTAAIPHATSDPLQGNERRDRLRVPDLHRVAPRGQLRVQGRRSGTVRNGQWVRCGRGIVLKERCDGRGAA